MCAFVVSVGIGIRQNKHTLDVGRQRRDADERGDPDEQQRRDGLVEEALVDVGGLLEDDGVAAGPLGGACHMFVYVLAKGGVMCVCMYVVVVARVSGRCPTGGHIR